MAHWLYKSEPDVFSWADLVAEGDKGTHWNGVRNHSAKLNLKAMKRGDRGFFYHSNLGKEIVGVVEVIREAYPDHTAPEGSPWVMVDIKAVEPLPRPVPLSVVKDEPRLAKMALVTSMRLSVQPVTDAEWDVVRELGGLSAR